VSAYDPTTMAPVQAEDAPPYEGQGFLCFSRRREKKTVAVYRIRLACLFVFIDSGLTLAQSDSYSNGLCTKKTPVRTECFFVEID
jgi:hypothetical protein